jgi:hypothetical protein
MDTDFPANTRLVELTGNAAANGLDQVVTVQSNQKVNVKFLHNGGQDKGYLIYGLQNPKSAAGLVIQNASSTLAGSPIDSGNVVSNAKNRIASLPVVTANTINIRLDTQAVTLPNGFRDVNADGDNAVLRVNNGVDTNGNGHIDYTTAGSVVYGFEEFAPSEKSPGYFNANGNGWYEKSIDAANLPEGYNFITVRAFRKGVGGPAVFTDFRKVVYLDRYAPTSSVVSFDPYFNNYSTSANNRDLILQSDDGTANSVHVLRNLAANSPTTGQPWTNSEILAMTSSSNQADRDGARFVERYNGVSSGNHVATVVTYEQTGNYSIQRIPGLLAQTSIGLGFGDMNFSNTYTTNDIQCAGGTGVCGNNSVEDVLYSQNTKFGNAGAAFDVNGDGLGDNRDLFLLGDELVARGAGQAVLDAYTALLLERADVNSSGTSDTADMAALYAGFGTTTWLTDLNVDGVVDIQDAQTMATELFRTVAGDFNLDGSVDAADYIVWRKNAGQTGATFVQGDATFNGTIDNDDLQQWRVNFGFVRQPLSGSGSGVSLAAVPEPAAWLLAAIGIFLTGTSRRRKL